MIFLEGVLELLQAQLNFSQLSVHSLMAVEPDLTELFNEIKTVFSLSLFHLHLGSRSPTFDRTTKLRIDHEKLKEADRQEYQRVIEDTEGKLNKEFVNFQLRDLSGTGEKRANDDFGPTTVFTQKRGYLLSGEKRPYGLSWTKKYYHVVDDLFMQQEGTEPPLPVLHLKLCTVKLAPEIERNFCFYIISPSRTLLLQAPDSKSLEEWVSILQDGLLSYYSRLPPLKRHC